MNTLQQEGEQIAKELDLDVLVGSYGEAHLVGNLAFGTTVKPDIDYILYAKPEDIGEIVLGLQNDFNKLGISNFEERKLKESGKYLITFHYNYSSTTWSIDITLTEKGGDYLTDSYKFLTDYQDRFTPEIIDIILPIKQYFYRRKMLRNSMSFYIYKAVIDENAKSVSDIYEYLKKNKVYLGRFKTK